MISPRVWVSCSIGEDALQGMALAQQLISDLRTAGAEVVSESATLPDEQFLPVLQRELASCQWFILVQTPQGMGSRRVQFALQEARSRLQRGLLRGACLVNASSNIWGEPASWSELRSYTYNGDYPRLRDKLLLDLDLLQITSLSGEEKGNVAMGLLPLVQEMPGFQQQAITGSADRPVPFQERSAAMEQSSASFQLSSSFEPVRQMESMASRYLCKTPGEDRPVPLRFSRLRSAIIAGFAGLLAGSVRVAFLATGGLGFNVNRHANHPRAKAHSTPVAQPTQGHTMTLTPTPELTPTQPPVLTQAPAPVIQPTQPAGDITVAFADVPAQVDDDATAQVVVQTQPGAAVQFTVTYAGGDRHPVFSQQTADANGLATFSWTVNAVAFGNNNITAHLTATAMNNNGQQTQTQIDVAVDN
jgi:hypothetical protein